MSEATGGIVSVQAVPKRTSASRGARLVPEDRGKKSPGVGRIVLVSHEEGMSLRARLDDGYPQFFGGYGGWEDEPRPGQVAATVYRGASAPQMRLRLILGRWPLLRDHRHRRPWATNCEHAMRVLDHFARLPIDAGRYERPTLLRVRGHVPHFNRRWFVQEVEWGEVDVLQGTRVRAFVTVTLRMHVPVELLTRRDPLPKPTRPYRVKDGETLDQIVMREVANSKGELVAARGIVRRINRLGRGSRLRRVIKLPRGGWWRIVARQEAAARDARLRAADNRAAAEARQRAGG